MRIQIPNPCTQNPKNFSPTETGGYCHFCSKNVIDFTKWKDEEIKSYFTSQEGKVCGVFDSSQMDRFSPKKEVKKSNWPVAASFGLLLTAAGSALGQAVPSENASQVQGLDQNLLQDGEMSRFKITGRVADFKDSAPVASCDISVENSNFHTKSDSKGYFSLEFEWIVGRPFVLIAEIEGYEKLQLSKSGLDTKEDIGVQDLSAEKLPGFDKVPSPVIEGNSWVMGLVMSESASREADKKRKFWKKFRKSGL